MSSIFYLRAVARFFLLVEKFRTRPAAYQRLLYELNADLHFIPIGKTVKAFFVEAAKD
jgi:hypothetical protein